MARTDATAADSRGAYGPFPAGIASVPSVTLEAVAFRFRIRDVFLLNGRGTAVVGFIEDGEVTAGDRLILEGTVKATIVASVEGVRDADWTPGSPAAVGLILPGLTPDDVRPGDMLVEE